MTLNDPYPNLKVTPFFDAEYLINGTRYIVSVIYTVSQKKLRSRTLAITLSNLNRFQKFLHCCKEKEISNKLCVIIPTTP